MQQRLIKSKGKTYLVNCPTEDGVGAGFAVGQLVLKSADDNLWYVVTASGSAGSVVAFVSQSALPFTATGPICTQNDYTGSILTATTFFEQNYPYQLVASNDGNAYAVYLTNTTPTVAVTISQSAYGKAYITTSLNAVIDIAKPNLLLQNVSNGDYYVASLATALGTTTLVVNQNAISQSWVHPIY